MTRAFGAHPKIPHSSITHDPFHPEWNYIIAPRQNMAP
jgi:hypothetical protein